jgi:predicted phage baseplate assembly protein
MMLPAPDLDDRTFQDLVDDAKRLVQERCPTWTDHNVSDPGVTLIEAVAQMVDQLIYRVNRVPDRNYVKFLELIGVELRPPAAAEGSATFWLSAPQPQAVRVRVESQVATPRTDVSTPVVFSTTRELSIVPCSFTHAATQPNGAAASDTTHTLGRGGFRALSPTPVVGDAMLVGLSDAVPSCAVLLRFDCTISGRGVDPRRPPLVWEAWTGDGWAPCDTDSDGTGGLNKPGDVILHVPDTHTTSVIAHERGGWLRCRLVEAAPDQPTYLESPTILGIRAHTVGGTVPTINAEVVHNEILGRSDGTPAQRFLLQRRPVVASDGPRTVAVVDGDTVETWTEVRHFAQSGPEDKHFRIDAQAGEVQFGPAIRTADGGLRKYGDAPRRGTVLRLESYRTGGGQAGNVTRGQVRVLKTSIPYVSRVENRTPAIGGAEAETLSDAKVRGPLLLRSRGRAVTADDFEELARDATGGTVRVKCVPEPGVAAGVRVLVVPEVNGDDLGRIKLDDLHASEELLRRIRDSLEACRLVGTRVLVQPPDFFGLTAVVRVSARPEFSPDRVTADVLRALYRLFDPLRGGPEGTGWPFGRSVQLHEVNAELARVEGVDMSRKLDVALFPADAVTGTRESGVDRLDLPPTGLVYSFDHQVRVVK